MEEDFFVITSKEFCCEHCSKPLKDIQRAIWMRRICEHLQYNNYIKLHVTKRNMVHAESIISVLKQAFAMKEKHRIEVVDVNKKYPKIKIIAIEIYLEKIPAIQK